MLAPFERSFAYFDPLLLLPRAPERGLVVGHPPEAPGAEFGVFQVASELAKQGPALDALVALEWQQGVTRLLQAAHARLERDGLLLARLPNRHLPAALSRRLYPGYEPPRARGSGLAEIRRACRRMGFQEHRLYGSLPGESTPYVLFPLDDRRFQAFYLERLKPRWGLKGHLLSRVGRLVPPTLLSRDFLLVARKGG